MKRIGLAAEDHGHFRVLTKLIDDTLVAEVPWLDGVLDSSRTWCGLDDRERWYKYAPEDAYDLRPIPVEGGTIKPQGRIGGEPLKPEAGMWRKVLMLFYRAKPPPDVVVLIRDLDGDERRRAGLEQVRDGLRWPFPVVIATPQPEIEAWVASGFVARDDEKQRLRQLCSELSFDPTLQSHRLTSHPNDAPRDAKRVLRRLCEGDEDRELACLADRVLLRRRGEHNWLPALLDEVDERLVPVFR
ncbi:MAG TPA: hypothetical protein VGC42_03360 [Kofleriaceae bacterium]